jgi:serine acetyltransferase
MDKFTFKSKKAIRWAEQNLINSKLNIDKTLIIDHRIGRTIEETMLEDELDILKDFEVTWVGAF